jgi:hypothetical protein
MLDNLQLVPSPLMSFETLLTMNSQTFTLVDGTPLAGSAPSLLSGVPPTQMRLTLVCHTNDAASGMVVGDEVDAWTLFDSFNFVAVFSCGSNYISNLVFANYEGIAASDGATFFNWKGANVPIGSFSNFNLKLNWQ